MLPRALLCRIGWPVCVAGLVAAGALVVRTTERSFAAPAKKPAHAPAGAARPAAPEDVFAAQVQPFLATHCLHCHGEDVQEADLRLDGLTADFSRHDTAEVWNAVRDRLYAGEMPPEGEPQPPIQQLEQVAGWIDNQLRQAASKSHSDGVVMRRLNRAEYNNTIRDLLAIDYEPAHIFPEDPPSHGFDNVGAGLTVSPLHLEQYLAAAQEAIDRAIVEGSRPVVDKWHFELEQAVHEGEGRLQYLALWRNGRVYARLRGGENTARDGFLVLREDNWHKRGGAQVLRVTEGGRYVVRIRAAAVIPDQEAVRKVGIAKHQKRLEEKLAELESQREKVKLREHWDKWIWPDVHAHFDDPMYDYGPPRLRLFEAGQAEVSQFDVTAPPSAPQVYEVQVQFEPGNREVMIYNGYNVPRARENFWLRDDLDFPRPELLIDWIEVEGPIYDQWPPESHRRLLGGTAEASSDTERARTVLQRFMRRAFRRPTKTEEVDRMVALFERVHAYKPNFREAIKVPLAAVLTSPHFLYLVETPEADDRRLNDHQIACRLSYFLWSSMPDEELFRLADAGRLRDPAVRRAQVERMLIDSKSEALAKNFAGQWLELREVGANPPASNRFPRYDDHLQRSIVRESEALFAEILHHDLSVLNFLKSDFVVINERLARYYQIPDVRGDHFRRVPVPDGVHRGGLVTQASMLTITSNSTRTSPVARGVWILENLFNDPPAPPPPDVGEIAPKVPGINKATVRVRLEAHRKLAQCASCHRKIDPLGFALENFGPDGRWRDYEASGYDGHVGRNDPPIDASGRLPDGREFHTFEEFQRVLLDEQDRFLNCLAEKLMTYALGRGLDYRDRDERDALVANLKTNGYTLRGLIKDLVASDTFITK